MRPERQKAGTRAGGRLDPALGTRHVLWHSALWYSALGICLRLFGPVPAHPPLARTLEASPKIEASVGKTPTASVSNPAIASARRSEPAGAASLSPRTATGAPSSQMALTTRA